VIYSKVISGGTQKTVSVCQELGKPLLTCDRLQKNAFSVAVEAWLFCERNGIAVLNVAGPRESGDPGARRFAKEVVTRLIEMERTHAQSPTQLEHPVPK
jgi:hypothetical protein